MSPWSILEILAGLAALFLLIHHYFTLHFDFWRAHGIPGPRPRAFVGTIKQVLSKQLSLGDYLAQEYEKYKREPMFGIYTMRSPVLVIKDPEYIKDVLIKDFAAFGDRGRLVNERADPLSQQLFSLEPERWRPLRAKLSPIFTSGKLKKMFHIIQDCADHFERYLDERVRADGPVVDCRDVTGKFTLDVIGACAFGLRMNVLADEDCEFHRVGKSFFTMTKVKEIRLFLRDFFPRVYGLLAPLMYDHEINDFYIKSMRDTMECRKRSNERRDDFVDLLMDLKGADPSQVNDIEITDSLLAAQAFVFFTAGYESSSSTITHTLYELALNPRVQEKLREEILATLERSGQSLTYDAIKAMDYLHMAFSETLRKYPPAPLLTRRTTRPYSFKGTKLTIPANTKVLIPVYAIQHDSDIYPDAETYEPERFSEEAIKQRHPSFYLPFGDGPRICIGSRFAINQTKMGIVKVLKNYKVDVCDETCVPYVHDPKSTLLRPVTGIKLKFTRLQKSK